MIKNDSVKLIEQDEKHKEYPYYETFINFDFSRKSWNYTIMPEYLMLDFQVRYQMLKVPKNI